MIDTVKEIEPNWELHPDVLAAKQAEDQADAALAEATRVREACQAWRVSPDPDVQLQYRIEYPALDLAEDKCKVELRKVQKLRERVEREAKTLVQPLWDDKFREAWDAIERVATVDLFQAVQAWEQLVASKAAGITVPCFLPPDWYTAAILDVVRHVREKELHLDQREP